MLLSELGDDCFLTEPGGYQRPLLTAEVLALPMESRTHSLSAYRFHTNMDATVLAS